METSYRQLRSIFCIVYRGCQQIFFLYKRPSKYHSCKVWFQLAQRKRFFLNIYWPIRNKNACIGHVYFLNQNKMRNLFNSFLESLVPIGTAVSETRITVSVFFVRSKRNEEFYLVEDLLKIIPAKFGSSLTCSFNFQEKIKMGKVYK